MTDPLRRVELHGMPWGAGVAVIVGRYWLWCGKTSDWPGPAVLHAPPGLPFEVQARGVDFKNWQQAFAQGAEPLVISPLLDYHEPEQPDH